MGSVPQGIDHECIDSPRRFLRFRRDFLAICEIRQKFATVAPKNQPGGHGSTMRQIKRDDFGLAEPKRSIDDNWFRSDIAGEAIFTTEGVLKNSSEIFKRPLGRIDWHGFVFQFAKPTEIVETENMICMRVGVDDRIDPRDCFAKTLGAKIRWGIDLDDHFGCSQLNGAAQAFVSRIRRRAYMALAADHWNPVRCASAKKRNFYLPHCALFMA